MGNEFRRHLHEIGLHDPHVMLRLKAICGDLRVVGLIGLRVFEADRKGLHRRVAHLAQQRDDRGRVEPAAQKGPERDVADTLHAHGLAQQIEVGLRGRVQRPGIVNLEGGPPIHLLSDFAPLPNERFARPEFRDALENRVRVRHIKIREVRVQRRGVHAPRNQTRAKQTVQLRREREGTVLPRIHERLDAETVPGEEQPLVSRIADGEGEHPVKTRDRVIAPGFVGPQHDLGIAARPERVAFSDQFIAQFACIVNLSVENDGNGIVLVQHRLMAVRHIDHAQAPCPQRDISMRPRPPLIRPAMHQRVRHGRDGRTVRLLRGVGVRDAADAAHGSSLPCG